MYKNKNCLTVSIVSHGQGKLIEKLALELIGISSITQIIITKNIPESIKLPNDERIVLIDNISPKGFGGNHNAAYKYNNNKWFIVLNPDIKLDGFDFNTLINVSEEYGAEIVSPLAVNPSGGIEDNFRKFPNFKILLKKIVKKHDTVLKYRSENLSMLIGSLVVA
jgi:N-acetylglucosaminyl-diphospho-decaprenol L-rhamnosyltransferase